MGDPDIRPFGVGMQPRRSLLFVPGNRPDRVAKAVSTGADVITIDWEDAVAPTDKAAARQQTLAALADLPPSGQGMERLVRINPLDTTDGLADLLALISQRPAIDGIMLPKVRAGADVQVIDRLLGDLPWRLHVIIETADALACLDAIAGASRRTTTLLFGAIDLAADLGATLGWEPLVSARAAVVAAAARSGLVPLDAPWLTLDQPDGLAAEATRAAAMGFQGKAAIHPHQVPVIHTAFTPSVDEVTEARAVLAAFAAAPGGVLVYKGRLIEAPVIRRLTRVIALAERAQVSP
ncbi:MAG: CoA ester lyase [Alphaproteobacteria bacterium]|nr:MAG: CoA ester lyase [Alphaproteobacteria bacterium]